MFEEVQPEGKGTLLVGVADRGAKRPRVSSGCPHIAANKSVACFDFPPLQLCCYFPVSTVHTTQDHSKQMSTLSIQRASRVLYSIATEILLNAIVFNPYTAGSLASLKVSTTGPFSGMQHLLTVKCLRQKPVIIPHTSILPLNPF